MDKHVLVLSSSPRRNGNSDMLCDQFASGVLYAGHHAEKIFLHDKIIHYCTGCGVYFLGGKPSSFFGVCGALVVRYLDDF